MTTLPDALTQYVTVRRALGTKLQEPARTLGQFVDFLENQGAEFITTDLALRWAMQPENVQRATWARRLSMVRRFAAWLSGTDPRTQVPPPRLIDGRRRRNPPHIFTDDEVEQLMIETSRLSSSKGLRADTYTTLIGLLATTGLRPGEVLALARPDADLQNEKQNSESPASSPSTTQPASPLRIMPNAATNSACRFRRRLFSSQKVVYRYRNVQFGVASPEYRELSVCDLHELTGESVEGRDCRIFVIPSQLENSSSGIKLA